MNQRPTLADIAKKLGVTATTVSKALNNHPDISEKRKEEILETVKEMDYVPNRVALNLRKRSTSLIAVIVSDNSNPYNACFLKGVENTLALYNYFTLIFNSGEDPEKEEKIINELRSLQIAGVILTPALGREDSAKALKKFGIPYVLANRYISRDSDNYVVADDEQAGYLAAKYLIEHYGEREFVFIGPSQVFSTSIDRCRGFKKALADSRIACRDENICSDVYSQNDGYTFAMRRIRNRQYPCSIVCYSDFIALGVRRALYEMGDAVRKEISLIGIDNIEWLSGIPGNEATVNIPKEEIGAKSAGLLIKMIHAKSREETAACRQIVLQPDLVIYKQ